MESLCLYNCMRCTKWIPVVFITSIIGWSYYAYVVQLSLFCVEEMSKRIIFIFFYHIITILLLWSYYQTIFTSIKKPTSEFYLRDSDIYQMEVSQNEITTKSLIDKKAKELPLLTRTNTGGARYCDKCKCIKPDRAHHCGVCQTCVLKMDHHCPWVNNCVGYSNYKFFILFLFYAVLYCLYIAGTSLEYFIRFWNEIQTFQSGKFHLLLLFFISIMFGISIFTLLAYHIYLLAKNCTTLESFRAPIFISTGLPDKNGFNLSKVQNCRQVFGNSWLKAFIPICTSSYNGFDYSNLVRLNLRLPHFGEKSKVTVMGHGWGYSSTIFTRIDSICSNIDFPTIIKSYYRPQLQKNPFVDDSFLVTSLDDNKDPKFNKINDVFNLKQVDDTPEVKNNLNTVHVINNKNRHSSITFASIFNQNQSINSNLNTTINNENLTKENSHNSTTDGINFPTSIKQTLASSNQACNANDSLLLNERHSLATNKKMMDQIRITME